MAKLYIRIVLVRAYAQTLRRTVCQAPVPAQISYAKSALRQTSGHNNFPSATSNSVHSASFADRSNRFHCWRTKCIYARSRRTGVTGSGKGSVVHAIQTYVVLMNHTPDALLLWQRFQVAFHEALLEEVSRDFVPLVHNRHRVLLV